MEKISILIPSYNSEKYIEKCLNNVLNQTYENLEIIVINDASNDKTEKILKDFKEKDKRIIIISNKSNQGYGKNLNNAIKIATGKYISIVESDDYIESTMLETLIKIALKTNSDITKCDFFFIKNKKKIHKKNYPQKITNKTINAKKYPQILALKPSVWSILYKKDFLIDNQIFFQETKGASFQDTSFQFKCMYLAQKICIIDTPLYNYNLDNPLSSVNSKEKAFAILEEFKNINNFFKAKTNKQEAFKLYFELKAYIWNFKRINKNYKNNFIDKISEIFNSYKIEEFYKCKEIPLKYKIKMFLITKHNKFIKVYNFIL